MSVVVENVYRRNNDKKLSVVTKRATCEMGCGIYGEKFKSHGLLLLLLVTIP